MPAVAAQAEQVPVGEVLVLAVGRVGQAGGQLHVVGQVVDDGDGQRHVLRVPVLQSPQRRPQPQQVVQGRLRVGFGGHSEQPLHIRVQQPLQLGVEAPIGALGVDLGIVLQTPLHVLCHGRLGVYVPRDVEGNTCGHRRKAKVGPRQADGVVLQRQPCAEGDIREVAELLRPNGQLGSQGRVAPALQLYGRQGLQHAVRTEQVRQGRRGACEVTGGPGPSSPLAQAVGRDGEALRRPLGLRERAGLGGQHELAALLGLPQEGADGGEKGVQRGARSPGQFVDVVPLLLPKSLPRLLLILRLAGGLVALVQAELWQGSTDLHVELGQLQDGGH
mmetsp:Transcript_70148/g.123664  ORF Transcript_70148/g.123664 Transcript_70148/m.123664 type:complete len:332 (-) Transcript_70148:6879-7874(-)